MLPLAHILAGAAAGQLVPTPWAAAMVGFVTHPVLDAIPHTDAGTFIPGPKRLSWLDVIEAAVEIAVGALVLTWFVNRCSVQGDRIAAGVVGALLPDIVDVPTYFLFGVKLLHIPGVHGSVPRRRFLAGIATQAAVVLTSIAILWVAGACLLH
jgi:hypothetical protein